MIFTQHVDQCCSIESEESKGIKLRTTSIILTIVILVICAGCEQVSRTKLLGRDKQLLTVDFQQGTTLQYKFISSRQIEIDWDPAKTRTTSNRNAVGKFSESMEMVVAYTPIEVDQYGLATIKATYKSVKVTRDKGSDGRAAGRDAAESFRGKTLTFTVSPAGRIEDYSQLDELIREIGKKAFRSDTSRGRIKEPDMIGDFVATQWFPWDSISSIKNPSQGVSVGQSWQSKLSVPTPIVMRKARDVTYKLNQIRESDKGRLAVITSSYSLAESAPKDWPIPYSGKFMMSGTFGFLTGYRVLDLHGDGEELFNIELGRIEQYNQQYEMKISSSLPIGISANPQITIKQKLTMQLLEN